MNHSHYQQENKIVLEEKNIKFDKTNYGKGTKAIDIEEIKP